MDLFLDPATHDLKLTAGRLTFTTERLDVIRQKLAIRYQFFKGEWFADTRKGVPYIQRLFEKGVPQTVIRQILVQVATTLDGVLRVDDYEATIDAASRHMTVSFRAIVDGSERPLDFTIDFIIPSTNTSPTGAEEIGT